MHLPLRASLRALSYNEDRNNYTLYRILPKTLDLGICPKVYNCSTGVSPLWQRKWNEISFGQIRYVRPSFKCTPLSFFSHQSISDSKSLCRAFAGRIICTRLIFAPPYPGPTIEPLLFLIAQFAVCDPLFLFAMANQCSYWILWQYTMWLAKQYSWVTWVGAKLYFW